MKNTKNRDIALELYSSKNKDILNKYPNISRFFTSAHAKKWTVEIDDDSTFKITISLLDRLHIIDMLTLMLEFKTLKDYNMSDCIRDYLSDIGDISVKEENIKDETFITASIINGIRTLQRNGIKWIGDLLIQKKIKPYLESFSGTDFDSQVYKNILK